MTRFLRSLGICFPGAQIRCDTGQIKSLTTLAIQEQNKVNIELIHFKTCCTSLQGAQAYVCFCEALRLSSTTTTTTGQ